ncbi:MAG: T9SS type A sorting domain-containing protein, partial [Bacteroidota bacterium]|nr:T9SS type A sorting domain-containing protein [Bacteroidota bacterium]
SYDDLYPNANSPQDHNYGYDSSAYGFCGSPTPCNPACDVIEASSHGQYETFCVTRHDWPHQADSIVVTFDPLLQPCDSIRFTGDSSFRIHCDSTFLQDSSFIIGGPGGIRHDTMVRRVVIPCNGTDRDTVIQAWNSTRINAGGKTTMVFTPRSGFYKLAPCGVWCFTIKKCPSPVKHNVRIQTFPLGDTSGACTTDSTTPPQAFKISKQANNALFQMSEEQNYPNPLTWDKEFRTTIPFTIPNGGEAVIRISDATGKLIKSETMSFIDGGKHFFYFTATDLPAGKYYYQIEYPAGKVITNRSMLLIR